MIASRVGDEVLVRLSDAEAARLVATLNGGSREHDHLAGVLRHALTPRAARNRILWNARGKDIDEIVIACASVHVEQMSDRCWWIGIYLDDTNDGPYWMGNFVADSRGRMRFCEQENAGVVWAHDDEHRSCGPDLPPGMAVNGLTRDDFGLPPLEAEGRVAQ